MSCHSATKTWSTTHVPSPPTTEPRQLSFESHSTSRRPTNPPTDPQIHPPSPLPHKASERANHRFLHTTHGSTPVTPSPTGKKRARIHDSRDPTVSTAGRNRHFVARKAWHSHAAVHVRTYPSTDSRDSPSGRPTHQVWTRALNPWLRPLPSAARGRLGCEYRRQRDFRG
ncbi:hypothetical protein M3J07_009767 [Ascochyta lentis]